MDEASSASRAGDDCGNRLAGHLTCNERNRIAGVPPAMSEYREDSFMNQCFRADALSAGETPAIRSDARDPDLPRSFDCVLDIESS